MSEPKKKDAATDRIFFLMFGSKILPYKVLVWQMI